MGSGSSGGGVTWYEKGLKFGCTECGKCCTGEPGYVEAMCEKLALDRDTFLEKYCRKVGRSYSLLELKPHNDCIFLEKGLRCTVYDA